jgi:hypothetical protein
MTLDGKARYNGWSMVKSQNRVPSGVWVRFPPLVLKRKNHWTL